MLILVSGATSTLNLLSHPRIGNLIVPAARNHPDQLELRSGAWAMDNGAFSHFDATKFLTMLERYQPYHAYQRSQGSRGCLFVAAPDIVGKAEPTFKLFQRWLPIIHAHGFPVAYILQDGITPDLIPYESCDALFVGGTTAFKYTTEVRTAVAYANALGLWTHMGRVNTRERILYARDIGCKSCDGSGFSKWALINLPIALRWLGDDICTSSLEAEVQLPPTLVAVLRSRVVRRGQGLGAGGGTVGALHGCEVP